jgi:hypothetical protein
MEKRVVSPVYYELVSTAETVEHTLGSARGIPGCPEGASGNSCASRVGKGNARRFVSVAVSPFLFVRN